MICSLLAGCMKNAEAVNFAGDIDLGEDGVITKDVFSQLRDSGEIASICGKSGEISYKWTVPGTEVTNPQDLCMAVAITEKTDGSVEITLKSDKSFGFLPTLSVTLNDKWDAISASVYDANGKKLCAASVTGGDKTTLSFKISADVFSYVIRADEVEPTPEPSNTANLSDGSRTEKDKYGTDPVPAGKPEPVEPDKSNVDTTKKLHCTISIDCATILNNLSDLDPAKLDVLPTDGVVLGAVTVEFSEGESVFDVLQRVCRENNIHLEATFTPGYNSAYVEGIHNLYEFDCGELSGWMYSVNGWFQTTDAAAMRCRTVT